MAPSIKISINFYPNLKQDSTFAKCKSMSTSNLSIKRQILAINEKLLQLGEKIQEIEMDNRKASSQGLENPPLSRLFIIGPKSLTEEDFRKHFEEYGTIEELWMVKDKGTGDYKGITYIKFSKTSEAAQALEMMNGASLANSSRRIKVMIASSREQGSKRDLNEEEKAQRLFIMCAKSVNEDDLHDYFRQFGELEYVSIIRDKGSGESKGIAYVKFFKFSSAAKAYEECDRKYKPVFAEPRRTEPSFRKAESRDFPRGNFSNDYSGNTGTMRNLVSSSLAASSSGISEGYTKLTVIASPELNQDQLWKLFDIVPGMDYCQIRYEGGSSRPSRAVGEVVYTSSQWAAHAKEKLHGFEYPPGYRLIVKPDFEGRPDVPESSRKDLLSIAETLAQATSIIEAARLNPASLLNLGNGGHQPNCSVELPDPKPLVHIDEETIARCFVICSPQPLPNPVLRDLFCRFGGLIEVYMLANRNCGYAKYNNQKSAMQAMQTLHGAEVNGVRLKVIKAEEQRKRQRMDAD